MIFSKKKKILSAFLSLTMIASMAAVPFSASADTATAPTASTAVGVTYRAHVQSFGWQSYVFDGTIAGTEGKAKRVEALNINLTGNRPAGASITYQAHVENKGWMNPVKDGAQAGTEGQALRVESLKIALAGLPGYSVQYRVHQQTYGWTDWVTSANGKDITAVTAAGVTGKAKRLEAVEIRIVNNNFAVTSVKSINASQLKVNFTKPVDASATDTNSAADITKYFVNGIALTTASKIAIADDGMSAVITLASALVNGSTYVYTVQPVRSSASATELTPVFSATETASDTVAPTIVSATAITNSNFASSLTINYSEPVTSGVLKIDGVFVGNASSTGTTQDVTVSIDATKPHTLEYVKLTDAASNVTDDATLTFAVTKDTVAPTVVSVAPYGEKQILVTYSKKMGASAAAAGKYTLADEKLNKLTATAAANDTTGTKYVLTISDTMYTSVKSHVVTVLFDSTILDSLGNALAATAQNVTLTKDTVAPAVTDIVAETDASGKTTDILVKYSKGLAANATGVDSTKLIIVDANGVLIGTSALKANSEPIAAGDTSVKFTFTAPTKMNAKWNVTVPASLVTDNTEAGNASTGTSKLIDMSQAPATAFGVKSAASSDGKIITVTFDVAVKGGAVNGSATDPSKYTINGATLPAGTAITFTDASQKVATITLPAGFIATSDTNAVFRVSNIQSLDGITVTPFVDTVKVTDNTAPTLTGAVQNSDNSTTLTFSETVTGLADADLKITVNGTALVAGTDFTVADGKGSDSGKYVITYTAGKVPTLGQTVVITTTGTTGVDGAGNKVVANGTATVYGK